jgi:hypothetical protein
MHSRPEPLIPQKELLPPFVWLVKMAHVAGSDAESKLIEQSRSRDTETYAAPVNQHQTMVRAVTCWGLQAGPW